MSGVQNIQKLLNFPVHASTWGTILRCSGLGRAASVILIKPHVMLVWLSADLHWAQTHLTTQAAYFSLWKDVVPQRWGGKAEMFYDQLSNGVGVKIPSFCPSFAPHFSSFPFSISLASCNPINLRHQKWLPCQMWCVPALTTRKMRVFFHIWDPSRMLLQIPLEVTPQCKLNFNQG